MCNLIKKTGKMVRVCPVFINTVCAVISDGCLGGGETIKVKWSFEISRAVITL